MLEIASSTLIIAVQPKVGCPKLAGSASKWHMGALSFGLPALSLVPLPETKQLGDLGIVAYEAFQSHRLMKAKRSGNGK